MNADSSLVSYVFWVKNYTHMENKKITKVTIHHQAGAASPEKLAQMFNGARQASSNYGISNDGVISQMVKESDRAWTSGSSWNDGQAVTIEVANSGGAPDWPISPAAYNALINLCADICKRNGIIPSYKEGDINQSFTLHCYYQATACPGPTIKRLMPQIIRDVTAKMGTLPVPTPTPPSGEVLYKVQAGAYSRKQNAATQANKIKKQTGVDTIVVLEGGLYKVQCGAFKNKQNAEATLAKVQTVAKDAFIKEYII